MVGDDQRAAVTLLESVLVVPEAVGAPALLVHEAVGLRKQVALEAGDAFESKRGYEARITCDFQKPFPVDSACGD